MFKQLHRGMPGGIALVLATGLLGGCATLVPKASQLPAQKAVTAAYEQLYRTPSFAFNAQLRLNELQFIPLATAPQTGLLEKTGSDNKKPAGSSRWTAEKVADTAADSPEQSQRMDAMVKDLMKVIGQRYRLNYSGVVDLQHKQVEIIPEFRYESPNMAGYVRIPTLLDGNDFSAYMDLSAMSPWLVNSASEGKYSRVHLNAKPGEVVDIVVLLEMLRDISLSIQQLGDARQFSDQLPSTAEQQLGAVRKIQFNTALGPYAIRLAVFMDSNKARLKQQVIQGPGFDKSKLPALVDAVEVKALVQQNPDYYNGMLQKMDTMITPESQLTQTVLLDKSGRLLQSIWQVALETRDGKKENVKVRFSNQVTYSKFGAAKASYQPATGNWIDIKDSMDSGLLGSMLGKDFFGLEEYKRKSREKLEADAKTKE